MHTYYLAFDVSKDTLDAVLTDLRTKTRYFRLDNRAAAIAAWIRHQRLPKRLVVGSESTAQYHLAVMRAFVQQGFSFRLINPLLTKQLTRATIRKRKTDRSDSLIIAKLLAQGEGRAIGVAELDIEAKTEQRILGKFTEERTRLRLMLHHLGISTGSAMGTESVTAMAHVIERELRQFEERLRTKYRDRPEIMLLSSIPGIGWKLAFTLWTEIGDIGKFPTAGTLVAFAGLDPRIRQSGHTLNSMGNLTKRGSPRLRSALFLGADIARRYDGALRQHYEKKRAEGKKYTVAVCSTARKLTHRVFAVWKRGTPYIKQELSEKQLDRR